MSDRVKCPYCGADHTDLHEYDLEDGEWVVEECSCGNSFEIICSVNVTYRVEKIKEVDENE